MRWMAFAALLAPAAASAAPVPVTGLWLTTDARALVRIAPCGAELCGYIVKLLKRRDPNAPAVDAANRDPALRSRPIEGLSLLTGFRAAGDRWAGRIYDPESGRDYRSEIVRRGDALDVKGCLGPFCRTQHWTATH